MLLAVRDGIVNLVNETLGKKDGTKTIDKLDESGLALLHQAVQYDRANIARSLLDDGAEIDVRTREDNLTPLHIAARLVNFVTRAFDGCVLCFCTLIRVPLVG